jgi:hypothetical protein
MLTFHAGFDNHSISEMEPNAENNTVKHEIIKFGSSLKKENLIFPVSVKSRTCDKGPNKDVPFGETFQC